MGCIKKLNVVIKVCILLINSVKREIDKRITPLLFMHHALPVEEGIVYLEGDVVIVVSVASEQKGARVTVKGIVDKSHGTGHCSHNNLVSNK